LTVHKAFFASPFQPELAWVRDAIAAACRKANVELIAVDEKVTPGTNIVSAIHYYIKQASLGIVVLRDLNPNVMYELGLLHAHSKPTLLLAEKGSTGNLPFDIKSLMVVTYEPRKAKAADLETVTTTALLGLIGMIDEPSVRRAATTPSTTSEPAAPVPGSGVSLQIATFDWDKIVTGVQFTMSLSGCHRKNLSQVDEGARKGWRLKLRCSGGSVANIFIDLNGEVQEIDVE
jgi:nucleoside 2-deoxyribosyltransferase